MEPHLWTQAEEVVVEAVPGWVPLGQPETATGVVAWVVVARALGSPLVGLLREAAEVSCWVVVAVGSVAVRFH